jgi:plasmid stabilization system protein ParE
MKIVVAKSFEDDLNSIKEYLEDKSDSAFINIKTEVLSKLRQLTVFPGSGTKMENKDILKLVVRKYRYKIFYKIHLDKDEMHVARLIHSRQNFKI